MVRPEIPFLAPPPIVRPGGWQDGPERRVNRWLLPWDGRLNLDSTFVGVPMGAGAIGGAGGTAGAPEAMRLAWRGFTTYSHDYGVDIAPLRVADLGDISGHITDLAEAHRRIETVVADVAAMLSDSIPIFAGGNHGVTAPIVRGFVSARPGKLGLVNIDAHFDVRVLDEGPHNGTPFRQLIEGGYVAGEHLAQVGIHGFSAAREYEEWLIGQGATIISGKDIWRQGIDSAIERALLVASDGTDQMYVSVDMDVLAAPWGLGTSAPTAEGMTGYELVEAAFRCGRHPKVAALDIVELDPTRDVAGVTTRAACSVMLAFLAGVAARDFS